MKEPYWELITLMIGMSPLDLRSKVASIRVLIYRRL